MRKNKSKPSVSPEEAAAKKRAIVKLITLILVSAAVFAVYRIALVVNQETVPVFPIVLTAYIVIFTALIAAYLIYNRGMSRKNVTVEMLPDDWSLEKKEEYVEDGNRRLKKSSWMLILILAFTFTFAFDMFELFILPFLNDLLK